MKKIVFLKVIWSFFILVGLVFVIGCDSYKSKEIISIEIVDESNGYDTVDFDFTNLMVKITYDNNKSMVIPATEQMISSDDLNKLKKIGKHLVTISYESFSQELCINIISSEKFCVDFISDKQIISSIEYSEEVTIEKIADPEKIGYKFIGWFFDNGTTEFDFSSKINSNTLLVARFEQIVLTVNFYCDNILQETRTVKYGEILTNIPTAKKEGLIFLGWNIELANLEIKENLDVQAVFDGIDLSYNVKLYIENQLYQEKKIAYLEIDSIDQEIPEKEGYTFDGWYYDEEFKNPFDSKNIEATGFNITLYAKFSVQESLIEKATNIVKDDYNILKYNNGDKSYNKKGWTGYTITKENNVLFVLNTVEIADASTNLKPDLSLKSSGVLYVNKTGSKLSIKAGDIYTNLTGGYYQIIVDGDGMIKEIIDTTSEDYLINIPTDCYLWCPNFFDKPANDSSYNINYDMNEFTLRDHLYITNWQEKITISFATNIGDDLGQIKILPGEKITYPNLPTYEEYNFYKWSNETNAFYSCTITAVFLNGEAKECSVEIVDGLGGGNYETGKLITIESISDNNNVFDYWTEYGKIISYDSLYSFYVVKDTTIKAHYTEVTTLKNLVISGTNVCYRNSSVNVTIPNKYIDQGIEFRAAWVSPITDCVEKFINEEQYKNNITEMLDVLEYFNLNAVLFHIRIYNDALYPSKLNQKSVYMDTDLNMLEWVITECHKRGIEFHAWMNPYRVVSSGGSSVAEMAKSIKVKCSANIGSDPANLLRNSSGGIILNPGLPEVRQFIVDTCMEVIENYDVDAIHFDDYFYIDGVDDSKEYAKYNPNNLGLADWRRSQVDMFIEELSKEMRAYNKENNRFVQLGISPSGIYRNGNGKVNYDEDGNAITNGSNTGGMEHYGNYLYSDTVNWINKEWIDYIIPQSYWAFTHRTADYADVMDWWDKVCAKKNVKLYSGIGVYMADGNNYSWKTNELELLEQINYAAKLDNVTGISIFKFMYLRDYYKNNTTTVFKKLFDNLFKNNWKNKALTPEITSSNTPLKLGCVSNLKATIDGNKVKITFDAIQDARKYVIYRVDGKLDYSSDQIVGVLGTNLDKYEVYDELDYSSNYTYMVMAISGSNTLGEETCVDVLYNK